MYTRLLPFFFPSIAPRPLSSTIVVVVVVVVVVVTGPGQILILHELTLSWRPFSLLALPTFSILTRPPGITGGRGKGEERTIAVSGERPGVIKKGAFRNHTYIDVRGSFGSDLANGDTSVAALDVDPVLQSPHRLLRGRRRRRPRPPLARERKG